MAFFDPNAVKQAGVKPSQTRIRPIKQQDSAAVNVAQTFNFDIPRDKLIWAILISIGKDTTAVGGQGTLADELVDISLIGNGNKYMKVIRGEMIKEICKINLEAQSTGFYKLYLKDPRLGMTRPLPSWVFTSLVLSLVDSAPGATYYHHIRVSIVESDYQGEDLSNYPVLIEKYMSWSKYGTNTLWQEYNHERAFTVYGYLYMIDDNGTLDDAKCDKLKVIGNHPAGQDYLADEIYFSHLKELDKQLYMSAMATGFTFLEFPNGYDTSKYSSLKSYVNIATAGTNIGVRVLERYVLS